MAPKKIISGKKRVAPKFKGSLKAGARAAKSKGEAGAVDENAIGDTSVDAQGAESDAIEVSPEDYQVEDALEVEPAAIVSDAEDSADDDEADGSISVEPKPSKSTGSLPASYNALDAYMREIRAYRPMTREEEHVVAVKYFKTKDVEAAYKLVTSNLWLVVKLARDYERAARNLLDLVQEGNIGLMEAVKNYDPHRGVRFPSYAVWWVKAYIVRYLIANWRLVKIGTTQAQRKLFFNLQKEKEKLEREGFYPGPKLLAERLQVRESDVVEMEQRLLGSDMSVDAPMQEDSENSLLNVLPSASDSAEDAFSKKQMAEMLQDSLDAFEKTLNVKEVAILRERLLGDEKATLDELSQKLKVSKERIRQLENRIKEKLKVFLQDRLGKDVDNLDY